MRVEVLTKGFLLREKERSLTYLLESTLRLMPLKRM